MIDFATTTAFRLVRQLATGLRGTAMYLLIWERPMQADVVADLQAEIEGQMGNRPGIGLVSDLLGEGDLVRREDMVPIQVLRIDPWSPELVGLLDTNVVRLERTGVQFLFLTTDKLSEQLLEKAPNFRNRLTEVLRILPDDPSGEALK